MKYFVKLEERGPHLAERVVTLSCVITRELGNAPKQVESLTKLIFRQSIEYTIQLFLVDCSKM